MKTLYLHVGFPKTGSSFLQTVFARNADFLRDEYGLDYIQPDDRAAEAAREGRISSGNGQWFIAQVMNGGEVGPALERYLEGPSEKSLLSTENWFKLPSEAQAEVAAYALGRGVKIQAVAFRRDPFELAISGYLQGVKRGIAANPLEASTKRFSYHHPVYEAAIGAHFPIETIDYSENRDALAAAFLARLGLDGSRLPDVPASVVNRSISAEEAVYLRRLNARHKDADIAAHVSDYLVENYPFTGTPVAHTEETFGHVATALGLDPVAEAARRGLTLAPQKLDPDVMAETAFRVQEALCDFAMKARSDSNAVPGLKARNRLLRAKLTGLNAAVMRSKAHREEAMKAACEYLTGAEDYLALATYLAKRNYASAALTVCDLAAENGRSNADVVALKESLNTRPVLRRFSDWVRGR